MKKNPTRPPTPARLAWRKVCLLALVAHGISAITGHAGTNTTETLVQQLLHQYAQVETVSCDVRREVTTPEGDIRWLSRVYFQQPDRLHAANAAPLPRLIIADGETMFQHTSGQPRGFRRPIADLDQNMLINLRRVPGTLMEYLTRLQDTPEEILEPTPDAPIRRAYEAEHVFAVLEADVHTRLRRILFYDAKNRERQTAEITCDGFEEVAPGIWIAMQHQATVHVGENTIRERTRFSNYQANLPIPPEIFVANEHYADTIEWVDAFDQL